MSLPMAAAVLVAFAAPAEALCGTELIAADRVDKTWSRQSFTVPSASGFPTVRKGQVVETARMAAGFKLQAGDLVVYTTAKNRQVRFLKRIVAVGPTTVQMRDGRLIVGGKQVKRLGPKPWPAAAAEAAKRQCRGAGGQPVTAKLYLETLAGGANYPIAECADDQQGSDNTAPITVPDGHYFVLGDNRDQSNDSRFQGAIPGNLITHVAVCVRDSIDTAIPLILRVLYVALGVLGVVFLGMLLVVWRRRSRRKTA